MTSFKARTQLFSAFYNSLIFLSNEVAEEKKEDKDATEKPASNQPQPDSVSTDSGISMDSGISSGNSEGEVETQEQLFYEKPKHLNQ